MAESGLPSNHGIQPASTSSSAAPAPDWEMLTMSMSSSALGQPRDDVDHEPEKSTYQNESSHENSLKAGGFASDTQMDPLHANIRRDGRTNAEAEPFTEGWKTHRSSSPGLYGYASEQSHQEEPPLSDEAVETYIGSNGARNVPECLSFSEKDDGDVDRRASDYRNSTDEIKFADVALNEKVKCKSKKHPKNFSTAVWSIAVVASITGVIFLGHRLHLAYNHNQQLEIQLSAKDEKLNEVLGQVKRLKELLGNLHKVPLSRD